MAVTPVIVYATDLNGNVQSGAKLYSYAAGTTTPQAIYTDSGLGTPSSNPAVCDSGGRVVVWLDSSLGDYKLILTNSAGSATYFSQNNIDAAAGAPMLIINPVLLGDQSINTTDSPTFASVTLGAVPFSGVVADPGADRIMFWDDSDTQVEWLDLGTGLSITANTLSLDGDLQAISGLTADDGGVIIGDGTDFIIESGATLRASLGLAIGTNVLAFDANLQSFVSAFTAPTVDGVAGQYMKTDGAGGLTFATPAGGGDLLASLNLSDVSDATLARDNLRIFKTFNVKDYGAVVDGATDDSLAVQLAVDAIETAGGGWLHFPAGTCIVDNIELPANCFLIGEGRGVSILKLPASAQKVTPMFQNANVSATSSARTDSNITFNGLTFDGNASNQTVERWLQDWSDNSTITDPENDYTANGGGIGAGGATYIADDNYLVLSASGTAATPMTLAITTMPLTKATSASADFAAARRVRVASVGDESANTFVIVGTNYAGSAVSESIVGANAGTAAGSIWFKTVSSVTPANNTAAAVQVGIEEYDIGSVMSAGRRNPNFTTKKTLVQLLKVTSPQFRNCELINHKGQGVTDQGCRDFIFENNLIDDVGKNDGPYFPIYIQSYGNSDGNSASFAESEGAIVRNNVATNLERGFCMFQPMIGGQLTGNTVDGFGETAIFMNNANRAPDDADGICQTQTPGGAGALTLNGVRVETGVGVFNLARTITITGTGNEAGKTFTVTGTNAHGATVSDAVTGPNNATVNSAVKFLTVTGVSVSAGTAAAVTVGYLAETAMILVAGNTVKNGQITDIVNYGIELGDECSNISILNNHFESLDEAAIESSGVRKVSIRGNTFKNLVRYSRGTFPYGPFSERYSLSIGTTHIAGTAHARTDEGYVNIGTKVAGGEDVSIIGNTFIEDFGTTAKAVRLVRAGGNNLSGRHVITDNALISASAWTLLDETATNVFIDSDQLVIFNNAGSTEARVGYSGVFTDISVGADALTHDISTGYIGIGTAAPTRQLEVVSAGDVVARLVSGATNFKMRFVASGTVTGANEPEFRVANNVMYLRTNNLEHIRMDGTGKTGFNARAPSYSVDTNGDINAQAGVYRISGTSVIEGLGAAVADVGAITAYTAHASGAVAVTSAAATDLDTTAAALATLRGEVASMRTQVNLLLARARAKTPSIAT
jgi:hypothetical protein